MQLPLASLAMSGSTIVVGLNGALQKRFILPRDSVLVSGNVHRAQSVQTGIGGKGQDVAVTLSCLSYDGDLRLAQFVGSDSSGDLVHSLLLDKLGEAAMALTVRPKSTMRTCTSIVASDETTELVEPSGIIAEDEMNELMTKLDALENPPSALCIMGSMPPGCADEIYAQMYERVATSSTLCLVDSVVGTEPLLKTIAKMENRGPTLYKMNASELCKLAGVSKSNSETSGVVLEELVDAVSLFLRKFSPFAAKSLRGLAITDGKHPAYFTAFIENEFIVYRIPVPVLKVGSLVYPIGAGDSVAAGTLAAWRCLVGSSKASPALPSEIMKVLEDHKSINDLTNTDPDIAAMVSAFAFGLACGSASCLQEENSVLVVEDVLALLESTGRPEFLLKKAM